MSRDATLKFALTRDLTLADVVALRNSLNFKGYNTTLLDRCEGGIDFSEDGAGRKDVRFGNGLLGIGASGLNLDLDTMQFVGPLDTVVARHAALSPSFHASNELLAYLKYDFSKTESLDIVECLVHCFGVLPDAIYNRGQWDSDSARITASDNANVVNIFLGFDLKSALSKWTVAIARWPDVMEERLFRCWKCKSKCPYNSFSHARATHVDPYSGCGQETTFYGLLGSFEFGRYRCCDNCYRQLTQCTTLTPFSNTRDPDKRGRDAPSGESLRKVRRP
jgi:hypothetical protein